MARTATIYGTIPRKATSSGERPSNRQKGNAVVNPKILYNTESTAFYMEGNCIGSVQQLNKVMLLTIFSVERSESL